MFPNILPVHLKSRTNPTLSTRIPESSGVHPCRCLKPHKTVVQKCIWQAGNLNLSNGNTAAHPCLYFSKWSIETRPLATACSWTRLATTNASGNEGNTPTISFATVRGGRNRPYSSQLNSSNSNSSRDWEYPRATVSQSWSNSS